MCVCMCVCVCMDVCTNMDTIIMLLHLYKSSGGQTSYMYSLLMRANKLEIVVQGLLAPP